jgi:hypothetical protein
LRAQRQSGFYEIPAPIWQGSQSSAVVYLSNPGQLGRMPASVRNLRLVSEFIERNAGPVTNTATLVVVDRGVLGVVPSGAMATSRRRSLARAAKTSDQAWSFCGDRNFCLSWETDWNGFTYVLDGPTFTGTGWHNLTGSGYNNTAASMVNRRVGDSLLADLYDGGGVRYCAREQSYDSTFSNNAPFANNLASSWAMLGSADNRC